MSDARRQTAAPRLTDRLSGRAWSRAGAIAAVINQGVPRRVLGLTTRFALLVFGSVLIAVSVALTIWTELGPGPLDVFIGGVHQQTGLPLTLAVWLTVGSMIGMASMLGRRPGVGTVVSPLVIGLVLQAALTSLEAVGAPASIAVRVGVHVVAVIGIGVGAGALIVSGLGAGSGELLASAASDRSGRSESKTRTVCELSWIVVGLALGGPAGLGTLLVAVLVGPAVGLGFRFVDGIAVRSISTVSTALAAERVERQGSGAMMWRCSVTSSCSPGPTASMTPTSRPPRPR